MTFGILKSLQYRDSSYAEDSTLSNGKSASEQIPFVFVDRSDTHDYDAHAVHHAIRVSHANTRGMKKI